MPRSTRAAVGGVTVLVLLLVAAVSGLVAVVAAAQEQDGGWFVSVEGPTGDYFVDPVEVDAEVLDVDGDDYGWASVDVAFDTEDGGREVALVDLGEQDESSPPLPQVGDTVAVVHERAEPSFVLRADDPMLTGMPDETVEQPSAEEALAAAQELVARMRTLALVSLALAVASVVVTVVAVRRAPPPQDWADRVVDGPREQPAPSR